MRDRNRPLFNIFILIILLFAAFLIYRGLKDGGEGLRVMGPSPEERVSYRYSTKSVTNPENRSVEYGGTGYEEGSANVVTSVVVNYRAFDTLLEIIVLFASTAGVILLIQKRRRGEYTESSIIVKTVFDDITTRYSLSTNLNELSAIHPEIESIITESRACLEKLEEIRSEIQF